MASEDIRTVAVIAVDGSEHSDFTLKWYLENVHEPRNKVYIVHSTEYKIVTSSAVAAGSGETMHTITRQIEQEQKHAKDLTAKLTEELEKLKLSADIEQLHGEAGHAIINFAREKNADLIVVGSRGKGTIRRTFTGSVTDFVVHHSEIPVLVCRHKEFHEHHHFHLPNPFHRHHKDSESKNKEQEKDKQHE